MKRLLGSIVLIIILLVACAPVTMELTQTSLPNKTATKGATITSSPTIIPIETNTPQPTLTPIPTSTSTPEDPLARLGIIGVDALSVLDAGTVDKNNSNILIPNSPKEYLLGMKVSTDTNLDGMKMGVGGKEVSPISILTREDGSKEAYFSITRGTKELKFKSADGNEGDVSQLLPQTEPESAFKKMGDHISVLGRDSYVIVVWYGSYHSTISGEINTQTQKSVYPTDSKDTTNVDLEFYFPKFFQVNQETRNELSRRLTESVVLVSKSDPSQRWYPQLDDKRGFLLDDDKGQQPRAGVIWTNTPKNKSDYYLVIKDGDKVSAVDLNRMTLWPY